MYGSYFISGHGKEKFKRYLFLSVILTISVAWLWYLMWSNGVGRHVILMSNIPEWTAYITVASIFGLIFLGRAVYFRPVGESSIYVLKAFCGGFYIGFVSILNCYSVYVYVAPGKTIQYESEYEVTFPGPSIGKYSHCKAGLWIKDAYTKRWIQLCTNRKNLHNERKQGMSKMLVTGSQ
ncbi:hypothetical protein FD733_11630 [Pantoea sp. Eser]|nr:hypothetical protein [Pantoea sp. Eser]